MEPVNVGWARMSGGSRRGYWRDTEDFETPPRWLRRRLLDDHLAFLAQSQAAFTFDAFGRERGV